MTVGIGIDSRTFSPSRMLYFKPAILLTEQSAVTGVLVAMAAATFTVVLEKPPL